jgi:hypothetical protein
MENGGAAAAMAAAGIGANVYGYEWAGRNWGGVDGMVKNGTLWVALHGYAGKLGDSCHDNMLGRTWLAGVM